MPTEPMSSVEVTSASRAQRMHRRTVIETVVEVMVLAMGGICACGLGSDA